MIVAIADRSSGYGHDIATGLAALRVRSGRKVLVLDADRRYRASDRGAMPGACLARPRAGACRVSANGLSRDLDQILPRYDDVVIAADLGASIDARAALIAARLALVPLQADRVDPTRDYQLIARLNAARMFNPGLRVLFVLVGAGAAAGVPPAVRAYVAQVMAAGLCATTLHEHPRALGQRPREPGAPAAAAALQALYRELFTH